MKTMNIDDFKDRRSQSYLDRSSPEKNKIRTLSFNEQNLETVRYNSSTESVGRHSVSKNELYKLQKQSYQDAKKRISAESDQILKDSSVTINCGWLKVRGKLKDWTKFWIVLKPGLMLLYRSANVWVGTVVLSSCQVIQRPSKKTGFCFKIWHPLETSIWTQKGPNNEQFGALTFPLPMNYLICRALDETSGRCWIDALELTMKCSKLLQKPLLTSLANDINNESDSSAITIKDDRNKTSTSVTSQLDNLSNVTCNETLYIIELSEDTDQIDNAVQKKEVTEENQQLLTHLLQKIQSGKSLSNVILPVFILESRSLLEKLSDYYYHCDIIEEAVNASDPLKRMKTIVKFYLSGLFNQSKALKIPYEPIVGELYRCYFYHPKPDSKTFYLAEQVSHDPPTASFYLSNRKEDFCIQGTIVTKLTFDGKCDSLEKRMSFIFDGTIRLTLLTRREDYIVTIVYDNCKSMRSDRLTMELDGKITIMCEKTRYSAEMKFKLKPSSGDRDLTSLIEGIIRFDKDVLCTFCGECDDEIILIDKTAEMKSIFWKVTPSVANSRLKRYIVPIDQQQHNESKKLWQRVTSAIRQNDQILATEEKIMIEKQLSGDQRHPQLFYMDSNTKQWMYIHADSRPWNCHNDISTYENNFIIRTHTHPLTQDDVSQFNMVSILERIERSIISTIKRIELHEKQIHNLRNHQTNVPSPYIQLMLIIFVALVLKYIFR